MMNHEFIMASLEEIEKSVWEAEKKFNVSMVMYSLKKNKWVVSVPDELILDNIQIFSKGFNSHWFALENCDEGLNYYGITIIMLEDLQNFLLILQGIERHPNIEELVDLIKRAMKEEKCIIHFGV